MAEAKFSKVCTKCGIDKQFTDFYKENRTKNGYQARCKSCAKEYSDANKDVLKAKARRRYEEYGRDLKAAKDRANREANPSIHKEQYQRRKAYHSEYARQYKKDHPEVIQRASGNRKRKAEANGVPSTTEWRMRNPDRARATYKAWVEKNIELRRSHSRNRRAVQASASGVFTGDDAKKILTLQRGKCPVCKASLDDGYHVDHIHPLSKGGTNDKSNIQLLCPHCNWSKNARDPLAFMQSRGFLL